jgi:hypothetical protein
MAFLLTIVIYLTKLSISIFTLCCLFLKSTDLHDVNTNNKHKTVVDILNDTFISGIFLQVFATNKYFPLILTDAAMIDVRSTSLFFVVGELKDSNNK